MSLRNKAIIFAIALGTLPVIATGTITYFLMNESIKTGVIQYQNSRAIAIANRINQYMFDRQGDIKALSGLAILNDQKVTTTATIAQRQAVLDHFLVSKAVYDSIAFADTTGKIVLQTKGEPTANIGNEDYFQQVIRTQQIVVAKPQQEADQYVIIVAAPVREITTNELIGVVRTRIPIKNLESGITDTANQLAESGRSFQKEDYHVNDADGQIFLSNEKMQIGKNTNAIFPQLTLRKATAKVMSETTSELGKDHDVLLTYVPIATKEGMLQLNWSVIITNDTKEVFAAQKNLVFALFILCAITGLLVSAIAAFLANSTTRSLNEIARTVAESSMQIATTIEEQERTITQQASAVNQISTTITELGATSRQSSDQAQQSARGAHQVLTLTDGGSKAVGRTLEGMETLRLKVGAIGQQILHLSEHTNQIGTISILVSDLANQTNMLALNAAVEAVRAGEHGRGFGVVATEIRKLADQSKKSAEKIRGLVADIQDAINVTVMVSDEGIKTVEEGVIIAQETSETFSDVSNAIHNIVVGTQQISLNAQQQVTAIQQIVDAMFTLNTAAQETADSITQVKIRTQDLNQTAQHLKAVS